MHSIKKDIFSDVEERFIYLFIFLKEILNFKIRQVSLLYLKFRSNF